MLDLIIKNGQCYIDGELKDADVAVKDGKIHKIGDISEEAKEDYKRRRSNSFTWMH
jgi:dihydroorotase